MAPMGCCTFVGGLGHVLGFAGLIDVTATIPPRERHIGDLLEQL